MIDKLCASCAIGTFVGIAALTVLVKKNKDASKNLFKKLDIMKKEQGLAEDPALVA